MSTQNCPPGPRCITSHFVSDLTHKNLTCIRFLPKERLINPLEQSPSTQFTFSYFLSVRLTFTEEGGGSSLGRGSAVLYRTCLRAMLD